ncbi:MAG: helix-turn-helix domain-containing protein [Silicimonas sp.]|nr:helix-turn-helix domain-containing protein [Silicimonas sp.]
MYVTIPSDTAAQAPATAFVNAAPKSAETRLKTGAYLYFEGDEVEWLYQVTSGVLRLTRLLEDGRRQVIAFGYPGDVVGFPSGGLHHTDCDVLVDATLQPYRLACLEGGCADAQTHQQLLQAALREISGMQDHFLMLGRKTSVEKIASFLCVLTDRVGKTVGNYSQVNLPMKRSDIADFLGLTTETVSRTLTQLRKQKIIAIDNIHTIIVLRPTALLGLSLGDAKDCPPT